MKMPPREQIQTAIAWLENNEGIDGEADACRAVAEWIEHLSDEAMIRSAARKAGLTPATFRRKLAERAARL